MKSFATAWLVAAALSGAALATPNAVATTAEAADLTEGEVRKIDKAAGKLTLRHAEIRNLDMPAMTMVFQVRDRALLDKLKVGDKVRFRVENSAGGYVVTAIEAAR
ncbi:MAG: copper-binding protein [Burkholderiaceae bacterium]|nr:copper-binding protein [Burkholderiaceae bacterium]